MDLKDYEKTENLNVLKEYKIDTSYGDFLIRCHEIDSTGSTLFCMIFDINEKDYEHVVAEFKHWNYWILTDVIEKPPIVI